MKHIALTLAVLAAIGGPAAAQETPDTGDDSDISEGVDLLSEGARRLLRGLMGEVEPAMRDLAETLREWDFEGLGVEDLGRYHPPEVLPNGDIIIRRKSGPVPPDPPEGEIEL